MKKISKYVLAIFILSSIIFISCSSDKSENNGTSSGNFLPLAVNNIWKYSIENQSTINEVKIIGTAQFSGNTYYELTDDSETDLVIREWFNKRGASYFSKVGDYSTTESGIFITIKSYELPILKDDYEINRTWNGTISPKVTYSGNGTSGVLPFKVDYSGLNYYKGEVTLNGISYPNVIKTKVNVTINANGQISYASQEFWYAENIGIIKVVDNENTSDQKIIDTYTLN
jgi:hypothetical protein